jgi:hypothetical protein
VLKRRVQSLSLIRGQLAKAFRTFSGTIAAAYQLPSWSGIRRVATPNSMTSLKDHCQIFRSQIRGVGFVVRIAELKRIEW